MKNSLFIIAGLIILIGCKERESPNSLVIYDEALEQLFKEKYYSLFVDLDDDTVHIDSLFLGGHIDREEYDEYVFGLRDKGILAGKTIRLDYTDSIPPNYYDDKENFSSLLSNEQFITENFNGSSIELITDALYIGASIKEGDFKNKITKVGTYNGEKNILLNRVSVINFSQIAFNKSRSSAIIYFQIYGGLKYGEGWILFLSKKNNHWIINEYRKVFDL